MPLLVWRTDLSQQVERHLPVEEPRLQRARVEQLGRLARQFADSFTALGGNGQARGDIDLLHIEQTAQRSQNHCQGDRRSRRAADLHWRNKACQ
ncbi:hypothetical protein D3C76_947670 [compost metagenome]